MPPKVKKQELRNLHSWVIEAQFVSSDWRQRSWRYCELYDGAEAQWTQEDWAKAEELGVDPITVNRIFPTCNMLLGTQILTKHNLIAKGRSPKDSETAQAMSEGMQFVMDQWEGEFLITGAFRDSLIPGFGCLRVTLANDPRREKIKLVYTDWKEIDWDPFGSPWFDPSRTRYVFYHRWMDVDDLISMFWERQRDIEEAYNALTSSSTQGGMYGPIGWDEATLVEDYRRAYTGGYWADRVRRRVRPVEMWYRLYEANYFAVFNDGRAIELNHDRMSGSDMFQAIRNAQEVVQAVVPHIYVCTFLGDLELYHERSPFNHDMYPMVPFIGYLDRYNCPYGLPRQFEGQQEEVNKRRSMALAVLQKRRVIAEENVVQGGHDELDKLYQEANKLDGFMVVSSGKAGAFKIVEDRGELFTAHVRLLEQSEREIQEISGANAESMGYESNARTGVAQQQRIGQGNTLVAPIFANLKRSERMLGYQIGCNMQQYWQKEKMLRVTDHLTGADRFVALNQKMTDQGGAIIVKNDITQGIYDWVVAEAPKSDTVREMYLNLILEWVKRTPPQTVPLLLMVAFEIMDIPNKDTVMAKLKPLLGADPREDDLTPEQVKAKAIQELEAQKKAQAEAAQLEKQGVELEQRKTKLEGDQILARIREIQDRMKVLRAKTVHDITQKPKEDRQKQAEGAQLKERGEAVKTGLDMVKARQATDLKKEEIEHTAKHAPKPAVPKIGEGAKKSKPKAKK
jgi:hypothetical protein